MIETVRVAKLIWRAEADLRLEDMHPYMCARRLMSAALLFSLEYTLIQPRVS